MDAVEFEAGGIPHRARHLSAYAQFGLLLAMSEALPSLSALGSRLRVQGADMPALTGAIGAIGGTSDEATSRLFDAALAVVERREDEAWVPARGDIGLSAMIDLAVAVAAINFTAYYALPRPSFRSTPVDAAAFDPVGTRPHETGLPPGEDWFWRPFPDWFRYRDAMDGTLRIEDIARVNGILDVRYENEARARKAAEKK